MTDGLLIDFGGTIDTDGVHWFRVFQQAYSSAGNDIAEDMLRKAYIHAERSLEHTPFIEPSFTLSRTLETKLALQAGCLETEGVAVKNVKGILDCCMDLVRKNVSEVSAPVLERLSARIPVVLVTNFYGNMASVLDELGISDCFRGIVESAVAGVRKPDIRIMEKGCELLAVSPHETLMVGDSIGNDMVPAHAIGCRTCLLDCGMPFAGTADAGFQADMTIHTLSELRVD